MYERLIDAAQDRLTSFDHPTSRAAKHTIQTKLATDASAIESRVIRAIGLPRFVHLMFYIHALFPSSRQAVSQAGRRQENAARHAAMEDVQARLVDARGHRCPTPTLRLRRALDAVEPGEAVTVLADDPLARIDIPHFALAHGHTIESVTVDETVIRAVVRKAAGV